MKKKKGKLVVIDGADGSGKETQTKLLVEYLKREKIKCKTISFPRYKSSFHGKHIKKLFMGEFGKTEGVTPYLFSLPFALDRLMARPMLVDWLERGNLVIADRYVSASMGHQAAKLSGKERVKFVRWLEEMEYGEHKLPKEEVVIYLYVPVKVAQELMRDKGKDEAESLVDHQRKSVDAYRYLSRSRKNWEMVSCVEKGALLSRQEIHKKVLEILKKRGIV